MAIFKQSDESKKQSLLPLVRLGLILPFVEELDHVGENADAVLMSNGLVRETVRNPNIFVPVIVVHRFLEEAAASAKDPYFGVRVGERLDFANWSPFVDAVSRASTLGEFLIRFIQAAKNEASSARHSLEINASCAYFKETRTSAQEIAPAQNDAFTAAYTLRLLRLGSGTNWNPEKVRITVCDPAALPDGYLDVGVIGGDRMGIVVRFPTEWLCNSLDHHALIKDSSMRRNRLHIPVGFIDGLRQILALHLHDPGLNVDFVARLSGMSRQSLQRQLKANSTTLSTEVITLKKCRAEEFLVETTKSIVEIATTVGFTDSTSFARAFKSWTGESPRDYRKKRKAS
jgi:AraC-like DNA-binding protein